jgi:LmbE family N-acetylglucosaminyl deacetylase
VNGIERRARGLGRVTRRIVDDQRFSSRMARDPDAPILVASPHLDDAALDCWSVLTGAQPVTVVNVFAGVPPAGFVARWDRVCGAADSAVRARERRREDREALALAGRDPVNLELLDADVRTRSARPSLSAIDRGITAAAPRASEIYAPASLGTTHPDHLLVRTWAREALRAGVPVKLYADAPYCVHHGWPHWVTGAPRDQHLDVDAFWEDFLGEIPELDRAHPEVVRLSGEDARAKLAALEAYRTQFRALDGGVIGRLSQPAVHGFEVFWPLLP